MLDRDEVHGKQTMPSRNETGAAVCHVPCWNGTIGTTKTMKEAAGHAAPALRLATVELVTHLAPPSSGMISTAEAALRFPSSLIPHTHTAAWKQTVSMFFATLC